MKTNKYDEGGLSSSKTKVDPVSGNEVPVGSEPKEVRDDIDAKLSEGEYVVPADVVKFFGVEYFEKLRDRAKKGLEKMDSEGRIGGDGAEPEYNEGGVVIPDIARLIENAKVRASKDPDFAQMLASKGLAVQPKETPEPLKGNMDTPVEMNEGGLIESWEKNYEGQAPDNSSSFDPSQYHLGFYGTGTPKSSTPQFNPSKQCGPGTVWDEAQQMCVLETPAQAAEDNSDSDDNGGSTQPTPNKWMEKYDYSNPEVLVEQTMTTLQGSGEGPIGQVTQLLGGAVGGSLAAGVVGKVMNTQKYAEAMANAAVLEAQGLTEQAEAIRGAATQYADDKGIRPGGFFDPTKRMTKNALEQTQTESTSKRPTPSRPTGTTPTPSRDDNDDNNSPSSPTKTTRPDPTATVTAGASNKYQGRTDSSGKKAGDQGYKSALVERKEKEKIEKAQEAGKGYRGGYGFNKGGLVKPRNK